jgi:hypothetical protein
MLVDDAADRRRALEMQGLAYSIYRFSGWL